MPKNLRFVALLIAVAVFAAACGDDDATEDTAAGGPGETVTVTAVDYAFVGLPDTVKAGTAFVLDNESTIELHEFVAVRLPDDETRSVQELMSLPMEELAAIFPNVVTVVIAPPGETGFPVEGTGVLEEPGRYAILCAIPTGADPAEYMAAAAEAEGGPPEVVGGPPHFVQGMFAEVTVIE